MYTCNRRRGTSIDQLNVEIQRLNAWKGDMHERTEGDENKGQMIAKRDEGTKGTTP